MQYQKTFGCAQKYFDTYRNISNVSILYQIFFWSVSKNIDSVSNRKYINISKRNSNISRLFFKKILNFNVLLLVSLSVWCRTFWRHIFGASAAPFFFALLFFGVIFRASLPFWRRNKLGAIFSLLFSARFLGPRFRFGAVFCRCFFWLRFFFSKSRAFLAPLSGGSNRCFRDLKVQLYLSQTHINYTLYESLWECKLSK